jgi:hypothetical protein
MTKNRRLSPEVLEINDGSSTRFKVKDSAEKGYRVSRKRGFPKFFKLPQHQKQSQALQGDFFIANCWKYVILLTFPP